MLSSATLIVYTLILCMSSFGILLCLSWHRDRYYKLVIILLAIFIVHALTAFLTRHVFPTYSYIDKGAPFGWFYAPMAYFLMKEGSGHRLRRRDVLHLIPFACITLLFAMLLLRDQWRFEYGRFYYLVMYSGIGISFAAYTIWAIFFRGLYKKEKIASAFKAIGWGLIFMISIFILIGIPFRWNMVERTEDSVSRSHLFIFISILAITIQFCISLFGKFRRETLDRRSEPEARLGMGHEEPKKEVNLCDKADYVAYAAAVDRFIDEAAYLDPLISVEKFMTIVQIPRAHFGEFFQNHYGTTYSNFINQLRIAYACRKLEDPQFSGSIDELADQCGFRSRASFYRNFNQAMSCTPLDYRKSFFS